MGSCPAALLDHQRSRAHEGGGAAKSFRDVPPRAARSASLDCCVTFRSAERSPGHGRGTTRGGKTGSGASLGLTIDARVSTWDTQVSTRDTQVSTCDAQATPIDALVVTIDARGRVERRAGR